MRAAAEVFESKGYRSSTIDVIAEAAGVSRPTVYKYTYSKRALLDKMVETVIDEHTGQLRDVLDDDAPAEARLRDFVALHVRNATRMRRFYSIILSEQVELSEQAKARFHAFSHGMAKDFQRLLGEHVAARARGSVPVDTWIVSNLVLSMLTSLYRWYDPAGQVGPDELCRQVLTLLAGLSTAQADGRGHRAPGLSTGPAAVGTGRIRR